MKLVGNVTCIYHNPHYCDDINHVLVTETTGKQTLCFWQHEDSPSGLFYALPNSKPVEIILDQNKTIIQYTF